MPNKGPGEGGGGDRRRHHQSERGLEALDRTERFYKIKQLLDTRKVVPRAVFLDELSISLATLKRDLEYMRDRMNAPIVWDQEKRGYRFDAPDGKTPSFELPGLWFNASEAQALLTTQYLLDNLQPGLLEPYIKPLKDRVETLLGRGDHAADEVRKRIRILPQAARAVPPKHFELISSAVLSRKRLRINYYSRARDAETPREVSPQRLVHYRDNWYLDAWCHLRDGLRCFALECIRDANRLDTPARDVSEATLNAELGSSYGIFSGKATKTAKLRFTPERSRWVAGETWHPEQKGSFDASGHYLLEFPFHDDRELVMDILKHGPEVEVLSPKSLRDRVSALLEHTARFYSRPQC